MATALTRLSTRGTLALRAHATSDVEQALVSATTKRKWLDETDSGFANRCLPMLIANQWGWLILNDRAVRLTWNGGNRLQDLQIQHRKKSADEELTLAGLLAESHFGHGILTWRVPLLFQTPPGWNLYVRGPANWCKDGICPLDGVVETDWSSATFSMNWKVTRPGTWITFEEGEPICQIFPIERGSVERFVPELLSLSQNPELERKHNEWSRQRAEFNYAIRRDGAKDRWQKHYVRGTSLSGEAFPEHQTKLFVRAFRDLREGTSAPSHALPAGSGASGDASREPPAPDNQAVPGSAASLSAVAEPSEVRGCPVAVSSNGGNAPAVTPEGSGVDFKVVVSSENSSYMAWQTKLFCFSAITRLKKYPVVVVHGSGPLLPEFGIVANWGCRIVEAPPFRQHPLREYPPRNELGSLLAISSLPEYQEGHILFCEPDMLFVDRIAYSGELSGEYYSYLNYAEPRVQAAARKFGIAASPEELNQTRQIGVPYLIPGHLLPRLAKRWVEVLDGFEELGWIDIMYAFGLALAIEDLPMKSLRHMTDNERSLLPLRTRLIHYCYGDNLWNKRMFVAEGNPLDSPPSELPAQFFGTVLGEILFQIRQASACSRHPDMFKDPKFLEAVFP